MSSLHEKEREIFDRLDVVEKEPDLQSVIGIIFSVLAHVQDMRLILTGWKDCAQIDLKILKKQMEVITDSDLMDSLQYYLAQTQLNFTRFVKSFDTMIEHINNPFKIGDGK